MTQKFSIPSDPEQIQYVEKRAEKFARNLPFSQNELDSLAIAVTEVVANAIYHGNERNPHKKVHIVFAREGDDLIIHVRDEGTGFNPESIRDPLAPENLLKGSGRGIFIVKTLMDDVKFEFRENGTEVILKKTPQKS